MTLRLYLASIQQESGNSKKKKRKRRNRIARSVDFLLESVYLMFCLHDGTGWESRKSMSQQISRRRSFLSCQIGLRFHKLRIGSRMRIVISSKKKRERGGGGGTRDCVKEPEAEMEVEESISPETGSPVRCTKAPISGGGGRS